MNKRIYTVSEITRKIKLILEDSFGQVWVEGEVSNFRPSSAGHYYFSLKDEFSLLSAVIFNRATSQLKFKLEDGLKVICFGNIEVYPPRGQYQLIVEKIEPKGLGSLQVALEQLKQKLEKEGLFSPRHKKPVPYLPARIGVVTSLQGAAIKDILKVLERRFKDVHIIISPVKVQGEGAKEEIAQAIKDFNRFNQEAKKEERIDVLIVGRGGGSIEDLWAFNEEVVARAIYHSAIPVISAVGHERDWTIADLVADLRAPTPSAAAEMVIPNKEELKIKVVELGADLNRTLTRMTVDFQRTLRDLGYRLNLSLDHLLEINATSYSSAFKKLYLLNPLAKIKQLQQKAADLAEQIYVRMNHFWQLRQAELNGLAERLFALSPLHILSRGYSITFQMPQEEVIKDTAALKIGDGMKTKFYRGEVISQVKEVKKDV